MHNGTIKVSSACALIRSGSGDSALVSIFLILDFKNIIQLLRLTSPLGMCRKWLAVIYNLLQNGFNALCKATAPHHLATYPCSCINFSPEVAQSNLSPLL